MSEQSDPQAMLDHADEVQAGIRRSARWYPAWVAAFGLVNVGLLAWVPIAHGWWAIPFTAVLVTWILVLQRWKSSQGVRPVADRQVLLRWLMPWLVLYLLAVTWVGPHWLGRHVSWWALMGVVVSVPAFAEVIRSGIRLRV